MKEFVIRNTKFLGVSTGGVETSVIVPHLHLAFDSGRGQSPLIEIPTLLMTHGHLDHASGVPYYVSQRCLRHLPGGKIFCPPELEDPLRRVLAIWCEIEDFQMEFDLQGVDYNTHYPLFGNFSFKAIRSVHRVPSNGYIIYERVRKLKKEFSHFTGPEIAEKKKSMDLFEEVQSPVITFSGDTQIEFLLDNPDVRKSRILFHECTYVDEQRPVERARKWGHTHLFEIAENAGALQEVDRLVLIHFSPRYSRDKIESALKRHLPPDLYARTTAFV